MTARLTIPSNRSEPTPQVEPQAQREASALQAAHPTSHPASRLRPVASGMKTAFGGVLLAVGVITGVGLMEYANPSDVLRPSYLLGTLGGRKEAAELNAAKDAQASYMEAVKEGELKAQVAFEEKLATIKADAQNVVNAYAAELERTNKAYEVSYQLTSMSLQSALQMEHDLASMRAQTVAKSQGTKRFLANAADFMGIVGMLGGDSNLAETASEYGDSVRDDMAREVSRSGQMDVGGMYSQIMNRVPNVAALRIQQEQNIQAAIAAHQGATPASLQETTAPPTQTPAL